MWVRIAWFDNFNNFHDYNYTEAEAKEILRTASEIYEYEILEG